MLTKIQLWHEACGQFQRVALRALNSQLTLYGRGMAHARVVKAWLGVGRLCFVGGDAGLGVVMFFRIPEPRSRFHGVQIEGHRSTK